MADPERLEIWPTSDGRWRWRYVGASGRGEKIVLLSNMDHLSAQEAEHAARTAYPDVPLSHREGAEPSPAGKASAGMRVLHLLHRLLERGLLCYVLLQVLKRSLRRRSATT